jgi:hypothetical protein
MSHLEHPETTKLRGMIATLRKEKESLRARVKELEYENKEIKSWAKKQHDSDGDALKEAEAMADELAEALDLRLSNGCACMWYDYRGKNEVCNEHRVMNKWRKHRGKDAG